MNSMSLEAIANETPPEALLPEVSQLRAAPAARVLQRGHFEVFRTTREESPSLFRELCRQREITFRLAGQGSGHALDVTTEDDWYEQLVLWDSQSEQLAGAYRLGNTATVIPERGIAGLYLAHMFDFEEEFFVRDHCALELTRSFVGKDYQNDRLALPLLWQGLGVMVQRLQVTRMFGSVTLSADFSEESRAAMVSWLTRYRRHQPAPLARALVKFPDETSPGWDPSRSIDELRESIVDHEGKPKPIPPLLRHYLKLGASFHDFHIEASFGDAVYCLLEVEMAGMPSTHRAKFIPTEEKKLS
ncbi:MAG: GNAT family N-acetyltransferase [Verrucomicrobiota bacterium JB023]|nr:GNAT family N-acetyltransferase [Verrucomicrobiota bacterium JB023]